MKIATPLKATPATRIIGKPVKAVAVVADRVTVRLKPELAARLDAAKHAQGLSATQVIESALESHLPAARSAPRKSLIEVLRELGLVGCMDLGPDASVKVREGVREYLAKKYPHH